MNGRIVVAALCAAACGDNKASTGLATLVPDPAVEVGCHPGLVSGTRAKVVACGEELIAGRLAAGRVGDFVLENANLRVIVRGPGEGFYQHGTTGGGIVDAASVGGEDLVKEMFPAIDLAAGGFDEMVITEAGDDAPAEIVVRGHAVGLEIVQAVLVRELPDVVIEHHYRLATDAHEVELETRVFAADGAAHELYDAMFMGGRAPAFLPGKGFDSGAGGAEIAATAGTTTSYGLVYPVDVPQVIDLAGIRLIEGPDTDAKGTTRFLVIGDGSVSSVTERGWQLRGVELGTITGTTAPGVDITVSSGGKPTTIARADASGAYRAAVPFGVYSLQATSIGRLPGAEVPITVAGDATADVPAGAGGSIAIHVRDDKAAAIPARVLISPAAGGDERIEWVGASGDATFAVPVGMWRVSVSRGIEYEAFVAAAAEVTDGQTATLSPVLAHVVDTAGWISLDTHLHSEMSTDSTLPLDDRLRAVAGEGVEIPVSTDHDIIVDYTPVIEELGLDGVMGTLNGEESSSIVWGHINGYPLVPDPAKTGRGSAHWQGKAPTDVFAQLRGNDADNRIVQVNHPHDGTTSLFDALELDPATLTVHRDPTALGLAAGTDLSDLSFDAMEVANTLVSEDFEETFDDFLNMVTAGHPACAMGSSDSHGASRFAGGARTFVFVGAGNDDPTTIDPATIVAAIKARHVVVGTGAFVTAGIKNNGVTSIPGDTVELAGLANVTLHVKVQAASWQPTASVRIFQGTTEVKAIALDTNDTNPVRFDQDVVLPLPTASTFWVVRVDMGGRGDPVLGDSMPSFTNPVFGHL